jgi:hypothetical protein
MYWTIELPKVGVVKLSGAASWDKALQKARSWSIRNHLPLKDAQINQAPTHMKGVMHLHPYL